MIAGLRIVVLAGLLALWWIVAEGLGTPFIPAPGETASAGLRLLRNGELLPAVGNSLLVFFLGFVLAALVGLAAGVAMGASRVLGRVLDPFAYAFAATPRVAFIPLIIVLLGVGTEAKLTVVFLGALMPILLNTSSGVAQTDPALLEMARSVKAGRWAVFSRIMVPGALPAIVTGLRIGATIGLISTVVAELYTAVQGLGGLLALYGNSFRMAEYFVVVLTLAAIGVAVTESLRWLEKLVQRRGHG
jgi:ABC-type nitrate/sulfonate/bicarbonate transport system permease component